MQITLNQHEVSEVVLGYMQEKLSLDDSNNFHVEVNEDGSITVSVNEDNSGESQPSGSESRPKKSRRTKAQIEADNKAEAERKQAAEAAAAAGNDAGSTPKPGAQTPTVEEKAAGEITQEQSAPGNEESNTAPSVDTPVVEPEVEAEVVVETKAEGPVVEEPATEAAPVKPAGVSLFQNLRRPNNG